jgi:hypothetical protein
MTALRLISLPLHGAAEMAIGLITLAAPFALGLGAAATVVAVAVGALTVGLALTTIDDHRLRVGTHHASDYGLALGVAIAAVALALAGADGAFYFAALAAAQLALNLTTRYSAPA